MARVQKLKEAPDLPQVQDKRMLTPEQFQNEVDYIRSTIILRKLREKGLITELEFRKIDKLNRQSFNPLLSPLMD